MFCFLFRSMMLIVRARTYRSSDVKTVHRVLSRCYLGDWWVLYQLGRNSNTHFFRFLLRHIEKQMFNTNGEVGTRTLKKPPLPGKTIILIPGVDFIKQFTPYTWNLSSGRIFFPSLTIIYLPLRPTYCIFSQIWVLYALRHGPIFWNPPLVCMVADIQTFKTSNLYG
jgi:hypothetical protein